VTEVLLDLVGETSPSAYSWTQDFEGGTNGATVATPTFDVIYISSANATATYNNTFHASGSLSFRITALNSFDSVVAEKRLDSSPYHYISVWIYVPSAPSAEIGLVAWGNSANAGNQNIRMNTAGKILSYTNTSSLTTSTNNYTGAWYRYEMDFGSPLSQRCRIYDASGTLQETLNFFSASYSTNNNLWIGGHYGGAANYNVYFDKIQVSTSPIPTDITASDTGTFTESAPTAPVVYDTFTGANGTAWSGTNWTTGQSPVTGGGADLNGNYGRLRTGTTGGYSDNDVITRRANLATPPSDVEIYTTYKVGSSEIYPALMLRSTSDSTLYYFNGYALQLYKSGTINLKRFVAGVASTIGTASFTFTANVDYKVRYQALGSTIRARFWAASSAEPTSWNISVTDASLTSGPHGIVVLGGAAAASSDVYFDEFALYDLTTSRIEATLSTTETGAGAEATTIAATTTAADLGVGSDGAAFRQNVGSATATSLGTTLTITVPNAIPIGDTLLARVAHAYNASAPTITDTRGNTWTRDRTAPSTGTISRLSIYSCPVTVAIQAADTITITTPNVTDKVAVVDRFSGLLTNVDVTNGATGSSTAPAVSASSTTAQATELWIGVASVEGSTSDTYTEASGYTTLSRVGTSAITVNAAYQSKQATGAPNYQPTLGTSRGWVDFVATYKATAGTLVAAIPGSDTGTGTDATSTRTATLTASDTGAGVESTLLDTGTPKSDADTGTILDAVTVVASIAGSETGTGADTGSVTVVVQAVSDGDTVTGTDAASVYPTYFITDSDTVVADDSSTLLASVAAADQGTAVERTSAVDYFGTFFTLPTYRQRAPWRGRLTLYVDVAYSVLKNGSSYTQVRDPLAEDVESADIAYLGGRDYIVSDAEIAALTDAGYGAYLLYRQYV
jgi:hypothetical protein